MSVIHTEGFQRFSRGRFLNGYTDPTQVMLPDTTWEHSQSMRGDVNAYAETKSWGTIIYQDGMAVAGIVQDPLVASKNRLACNGGDAPAVGGTFVRRTIRHKFATPVTHWMFGFLLRGVSGSLTSAISHMNVLSVGGYDAPHRQTTVDWSNIAIIPDGYRFANNYEIITLARAVPGTNLITPASTGMYYSRSGYDVPQVKPLVLNTDYFVEMEIDTVNLLGRVWVDDFLVYQLNLDPSSVAALQNGVALSFGTFGANSRNPAVVGNMLISDMYVVDATDGVAPTTRLGPSTRVWGDAPDSDSAVEFERPASFASNAAVVSRQFSSNAAPSEYVAGEAIGTEDLYNPKPALAAVAARVYGVTLRVQAANGGATAHTLSAVADNGTDRVESDLPLVPAGSGFEVRQTVLPVSPSGLPWTPAEIDTVTFGMKIKS